jgi:FkbM family methyltransferase
MRILKNVAIKTCTALLGRYGYDLTKVNPYTILDFHNLLFRTLAQKGKLNFLQIGGNDGVLADPLYSFVKRNVKNVSGYILEPIPDYYNELVSNYAFTSLVTPVNLGIHSSVRKMPIYRVKPELQKFLPKHVKGVASFDSDHWLKSGHIPSSDYIEELTVDCIDINDFCRAESISELDLLLIDTEGYDFEIILSLDFEQVSPRIIRFEHGLSDGINSKEAFMSMCDFLNQHGYQVIGDSYDATAYKLDSNELLL